MKNIFLLIVVIGLLFTSCRKFEPANGEFPKGLENKALKDLRLDLIQNLNDINSNIESLKTCEIANEIIINQIERTFSE